MRSKIFSKINICFLVVCALLICSIENIAQAQKAQKQLGQRRLLCTSKLDYEPSATYLPKLDGSKFIQGINKSGLTDGVCYHLQYASNDNSQRVIEKYEKLLTAAGYKITEKKKIRIMALRPDVGTCVMVNLMPFPLHDKKDMGFKTYYQLRYVVTPPVK